MLFTSPFFASGLNKPNHGFNMHSKSDNDGMDLLCCQFTFKFCCNAQADWKMPSKRPRRALAYEKYCLDDENAVVSSCSCPVHSAAGTAWQNLPAKYSSNFGAMYSGQFLVSDLEGATNETLNWRLLCLQFNGAAMLMVDSRPVLGTNVSSSPGAGYRQSCAALQLQAVSPSPLSLTLLSLTS